MISVARGFFSYSYSSQFAQLSHSSSAWMNQHQRNVLSMLYSSVRSGLSVSNRLPSPSKVYFPWRLLSIALLLWRSVCAKQSTSYTPLEISQLQEPVTMRGGEWWGEEGACDVRSNPTSLSQWMQSYFRLFDKLVIWLFNKVLVTVCEHCFPYPPFNIVETGGKWGLRPHINKVLLLSLFWSRMQHRLYELANDTDIPSVNAISASSSHHSPPRRVGNP